MRIGRLGKTVIMSFAIIVLIIMIIVGFGVFSYKKNFDIARNELDLTSSTKIAFNGTTAKDGSINILLLGSDARGAEQGRSDSLMVAHYDKKSKTPKLISFMRDMYVDIPGHGKNKINAAYAYGGPELVRETITANFKMDIQYYMIVNFQTFPKVIDTLAPNGIEINAEKAMSENIEKDIEAGKQHMNGFTLLQYARFRHDAESDFGRVRRQQQVLKAISTQAVSTESLPKIPAALGRAMGYTQTNIPSTKLLSVAMDFARKKTKPVQTFVLPVADSWSGGSYAGAGSVLEIDLQMNQDALKNFLEKS